MNMQALNIDLNTNDKQMAIIPMSEYRSLIENFENTVDSCVLDILRQDDQEGIRHIYICTSGY